MSHNPKPLSFYLKDKPSTTTNTIVYKHNAPIQRFEYADSRMPISMTMGTDKYYLHYDQVGTLRAVTDINHNILKEVTYDTFGNILNDTNQTLKLPFGFAGGLYDVDTKLTRFGYRDYDAYAGKWTAKDPIGFAGGDSNLYGYVLGDPVNFVDPEGLRKLSLNDINNLLNLPNKLQTANDLQEFLKDPKNREKVLNIANSLCSISWLNLNACGNKQITDLLDQLDKRKSQQCLECSRGCGEENCDMYCK